MQGLTHIDDKGQAIMVDVTEKEQTERYARASGTITMNTQSYEAIVRGSVPKGDVFAAARIAGIMATKKTSELIPLCHPLALTKATVDFSPIPEENKIRCECSVKLFGKTGAEMEALTGVSTALLTIYDMCKALDKSMTISDIHLEEKRGGKSGEYLRETN